MSCQWYKIAWLHAWCCCPVSGPMWCSCMQWPHVGEVPAGIVPTSKSDVCEQAFASLGHSSVVLSCLSETAGT